MSHSRPRLKLVAHTQPTHKMRACVNAPLIVWGGRHRFYIIITPVAVRWCGVCCYAHAVSHVRVCAFAVRSLGCDRSASLHAQFIFFCFFHLHLFRDTDARRSHACRQPTTNVAHIHKHTHTHALKTASTPIMAVATATPQTHSGRNEHVHAIALNCNVLHTHWACALVCVCFMLLVGRGSTGTHARTKKTQILFTLHTRV